MLQDRETSHLYTAHSILCTMHNNALCTLYNTVYSVYCTHLYTVQCTVYIVYSILCSVYKCDVLRSCNISTWYRVQCTLYHVHCTVYTVYSIQFTVYIVHCNVQCTLYYGVQLQVAYRWDDIYLHYINVKHIHIQLWY